MEVELVHLNRSSGRTWVLPSSQLIFIQGSYHKKLWKSLENCKKKIQVLDLNALIELWLF